MSVYGRKMFKRNAREKLNQTAGIKNLPTQKFQAGGAVGTDDFRIGNQSFMITSGANPQVYLRTQTGAVPVNANVASQVLARFRSPQLNTRSKFAASTGSSLPMGTVAPSGKVTLDQGQASGIASLIRQQQDPNRPSTSLVESALRPNAPIQFEERYPLSSGLESLVFGQGAPKTAGAKALRTTVTAIPKALDFVGVPLIETASQSQAGVSRALSMMTPEREEELLSGADTLTDEEAAKFNADPTLVPPRLRAALIGGDVESGGVDLIKIGATGTSGEYSKSELTPQEEAAGLAVAGAMPGTAVGVTKTGPTFDSLARQAREAGTYEKEYATDAAPVDATTEGEAATAQAAGEEAAVTAPEDREAVREAGTYEKEYVSPKEEIDRVINEGTPEEQQDQLKQLMAEFTENVPEYKGIDKGLALAKIGFAMAAGKSPRAIENIAAAMEQGADMLIKDQSKKDEFNRQVQLSALQYGLKDIAAERQLKRSAEFQTSDYVLMPGQTYTYPDGRTVTGGEGGTTISLRKSDILENGLPDGVQGTTIATALIDKQAAIDKAIRTAAAEGIKSRTLDSPKAITEFVDNYDKSVTDVIQSNNAMHLTKQVMIMNAEGEITGFRPGFNSLLARAMTLAGVDATEYTDRDLAIADLRKVFQKLVPLTLGKDQSANSISDKDVNRLADAYMSEAVLNGGILGLMTTPSNVLNSKLSGILVEFENAQASALDRLNSLEQTGAEFLTPSGSVLGTRVSSQRERLQQFLPQGSRPMLTIGEDGVYRIQ